MFSSSSQLEIAVLLDFEDDDSIGVDESSYMRSHVGRSDQEGSTAYTIISSQPSLLV